MNLHTNKELFSTLVTLTAKHFCITYQNELSQLTFVEIPDEKDVFRSFERLIRCMW